MSDAQKKLEAIKRLILADLDATSDEELRKELIEDGECPEKVADGMRVSLETLTRKFQSARGAALPAPLSDEQIDAVAHSLWPEPAHGWNEEIGRPFARAILAAAGVALPDPVRAALEELVSCHFSVIEHPDAEEEARRSHQRMAAAWKQALIALGKMPAGVALPATARDAHRLADEFYNGTAEKDWPMWAQEAVVILERAARGAETCDGGKKA